MRSETNKHAYAHVHTLTHLAIFLILTPPFSPLLSLFWFWVCLPSNVGILSVARLFLIWSVSFGWGFEKCSLGHVSFRWPVVWERFAVHSLARISAGKESWMYAVCMCMYVCIYVLCIYACQLLCMMYICVRISANVWCVYVIYVIGNES